MQKKGHELCGWFVEDEYADQLVRDKRFAFDLFVILLLFWSHGEMWASCLANGEGATRELMDLAGELPAQVPLYRGPKGQPWWSSLPANPCPVALQGTTTSTLYHGFWLELDWAWTSHGNWELPAWVWNPIFTTWKTQFIYIYIYIQTLYNDWVKEA